MLTSILKTKHLIPQPKPRVVIRQRLQQLLANALSQPMIFLAAPAGFGKSTLVSTWLHNLPPQTVGDILWLALDENDNNLAHFLLALATAVEPLEIRFGASPGETLLTLMQSKAIASSTVLVNTLQPLLPRLTGPLLLVLDDYQFITDRAIHTTLLFLSQHLAPHLRLLVLSRALPPPPLARLRAHGQMALLEGQDLRFTLEETTRYFHQTIGLHLSEAQLALLAQRTEGWIAGLQLAALALQDRPYDERGPFIARFNGEAREVFDYLVEEVLHRHPADTQRFLLQTAFLHDLNGSLCDAVTGRNDGTATLEALTRNQAFIIPLVDQPPSQKILHSQRSWYRYHPLWREALLAYTRRNEPDWHSQLYRRAATWYETEGDLEQAVRYWQAAQDEKAIVHLIERHGNHLWTHADMVAICEWAGSLSEEVRQQHPHLLLFYAWALLMVGNYTGAEVNLQAAAARLAERHNPPPELVAIHHIVTASLLLPGAPEQSVQHYAKATRLLPVSSQNWRGAIDLGQGFAYLGLNDLACAATSFSDAIQSNRQAGNLYAAVYAAYHLGRTQMTQCALQKAQATFGYARDMADREAGSARLLISWAFLGLADVAFERNEFDQAVAYTAPAMQIGQQRQNRETLVRCQLLLARIHHAKAENNQALPLLHQAELIAQEGSLYDLLQSIQLLQAHIYLAAHQFTRVNTLLTHLQANARGNGSEIELLWARVHMRRGDYAMARTLALPLYPMPQPSGLCLEVLILLASIEHHCGETVLALTYLQQALAQGWTEGYRRVFVAEGAPIVELLTAAHQQAVATEQMTMLLVLMEQQHRTQPVREELAVDLLDPLSDAEVMILHLVARGLSNQQIADARKVTLNTIKWHLKNIYNKLGVSSRTAAVARAQTRHWI